MSNPTLQIPKDIIEPIIQAEITKAIVEAMGPKQAVMQSAIATILSMSVDSDGKPTSYNGRPWIDWVIGKEIRAAATEAITSHLATHADVIKKQLATELAKKNSPLVKQLIEGMVGAMTHPDALRWRLNVTFDEKN
jgi:hypothetical protein